MKPLELWGGVECTISRVGDEYRDQVIETGHHARLDDIDAMVELGIKAVRYPILWEWASPQSPSELNLAWHAPRLERLRERGIRVIAGLLHHGSGPRYTDLLDPNFPDLFADYARRVAQRFPWIDAWNPINEPFTTARFSCLYGAWYPHLKDINATFGATVNECVAIGRAMRRIREVNPAAELIVTEDVGKTFATAPLQYQADHENERRWLSYDLLAGRVVPGHRFHEWLLKKTGVPADTLEELATGEATPDMLGFDHYLTSERFLDHRTERYPKAEAGSNGVDLYVDVEAVRVSRLRPQLGPLPRLKEAWDRYHIPIAVTEAHHSCSREEQVRWFHEMWGAAEAARRRGMDVRSVTLWAMFGMVDWRSLLTRRDNIYDSGAFDIRGPKPRATLLAKTAAQLGRGEKVEHPLLDLPGWWHRPGRTLARPNYATLPRLHGARPVLITGATGTLGQAFARICAHRGLAHVLTSRSEVDITDEASVATALERYKPWALINAAGFVRTWEADRQAEECLKINAVGPELLGRACKAAGIPLVTFSSDLVFDGKLGRPYIEPDAPAPACIYGKSKAEAEERLLASDSDALIIRSSAFFGPWDRYNFLFSTIERLKRGEEVVASDQSIVSPTYVPDLVHASLDLLLDGETGIWHLTNQGAISWHELAREAAVAARLDRDLIRLVRTTEDAEPVDTSLTSERGLLLRPLDRALASFVQDAETLTAA
jgi:dTDP-4-dehydrorhamnose reductase